MYILSGSDKIIYQELKKIAVVDNIIFIGTLEYIDLKI